jgi:hypothetical protein
MSEVRLSHPTFQCRLFTCSASSPAASCVIEPFTAEGSRQPDPAAQSDCADGLIRRAKNET